MAAPKSKRIEVWDPKSGMPGFQDRCLVALQVLLAGAVLMRFIEEIKNVRTTKSLADKVQATAQVLRDGKTIEVGFQL